MRKLTLILALVLPGLAFSQTSGTLQVNQTSLSAAVGLNDTVVSLSANFTAASPLGSVAVANGIDLPNLYGPAGHQVGSYLYVVDPGSPKGEVMQIVSQVSTGRYNVSRGSSGTVQVAHISGAGVFVGPPNAFVSTDANGACGTSGAFGWPGAVNANLSFNVTNGNEWICSSLTGTWVPGFGNPNVTSVGAAHAEAAALAPDSPFFHLTGSNVTATSVVLPLGFVYGEFTVVTDNAATAFSTAGNNIGTTITATLAGQALTFFYDFNAAKFYIQ